MSKSSDLDKAPLKPEDSLSMTRAEMMPMEEIVEELERRFPVGFLILAVANCECGATTKEEGCSDHYGMRCISRGHPAVIVGLAELASDEVKDNFRTKVNVVDPVDEDEFGDD